jgi:hypothetical protein
LFSCPLAMTDGAAFTLNEIKSDEKYHDKDVDEAL